MHSEMLFGAYDVFIYHKMRTEPGGFWFFTLKGQQSAGQSLAKF